MIISTMNDYQDSVGRHFDPVQDVTEFIRNCRHSGMDKSTIIGELIDQMNYMPTEADIIVNEFWDKTA